MKPLTVFWKKKLYNYSFFILTVELAKGTKMPKENKPRSGPPIMPMMLSAAYRNKIKSAIRNFKSRVKMFQINSIGMRI